MIEPTKPRRAFNGAAPAFFAALVAAFILLIGAGGFAAPAEAAESPLCAEPVQNPVACENTKEGDPAADWEIDGIGDKSIQGFATAISVNPGETEQFKINTDASKYNVRILRLGYYKGDGARVIEPRFKPSATLPQKQPECEHFESTGLIDCGNWSVSASWKVPANAVSGLYMAELEREDTKGKSQIFFVVKNEASHAPIVLKTSDATWEAYNEYGGNSLYSCNSICPKGNPMGYKAAYAVSYNRPFDGTLPRDGGKSDPFYAEYQMMRWLEKEGYNITYLAQPDIAAHPELLKNHKVAMTSGHDEYWTGAERAAFEAAREAGVNLAFFTGNETFWKTRWLPSSAGPTTANRTLVTYKETHFTEPVDPEEPKVATSSWRDPRFTSGGAGRPENELTGQLFMVNEGSSDIKVPGAFAKLRFWKHTQVESLTPTQTLTLAPGGETLGYEWDVDPDNGFRPAGRIPLSSTTVSGVQTFKDFGTEVVEPSIATHSLSLYRAPSGALVFGAGTVQWSWGLEYFNAWANYFTQPKETKPDKNMEQATINLLAEMGAQPSTLEAGFFAGSETTDHTAPTATVTTPSAGSTVKNGEMTTVSGTAVDTGGGVVAAVEVSTDGGKTWHPASGTTSWNYAWNADGSKTAVIEARATDDSANLGVASAPVTVNVMCPCSLLGGLTPAVADAGDGTGAITLGVKFQSEISGTVNGVRYFKSAANTGTHIGGLWTSSGEKLAEATFSGETATGWQKVEFAKPVAVKANTTYIAGYLAPKGHYADTQWQMDNPAAVGPTILSHRPLKIVADTEAGNGVFSYGSALSFPNQTYRADNYWVDVQFSPAEAPQGVTGVSATAGVGSVTVNWTGPTSGAPATSYKITPYIGTTAQTPVIAEGNVGTKVVTGLAGGTSYTFTVTAQNEAGIGPESAKSNAVTPSNPTVPGAPTAVSATSGPASATVNWTAPTNNGGGTITSYKITPYLAGVAQTAVTAEASATSTTVTGLTVGSSYTFTVAATNSAGTGTASAQSNAVVPTSTSVPGTPTGVTAQGKSSGALVSWTAPTTSGGSAISGYRITPYIGSTAQTATTTATTATSVTLAGLINGTAYTFKVAAINGLGTGGESAASNSVTPYETIFDLATPSTVDAGDGGSVELGVKFNSEIAGTIEGIRFYKAAANTGTHIGTLWNATGEKLAEATFTGETASGWQQVKFTTPVSIAANTTYVAGYLAPAGHYSANGPSLEVAANNPPLHAIASGSTGGNGVYAYGSSVTFPKESFNSTNYWVDVLFSPPAPPAVPGAPTGVTATANPGTATVKWTAPTSGGAPTSYTVTPYKAGVAQTTKAVTGTPPATETTISGLTAGASYTFAVQAANGTGSGALSAQSGSITIPSGATAPAAPTAVIASPRNGAAVVGWAAPNDGGSPITGYKVTGFEGATELGSSTVSGSSTSATIESLTNGTNYTFTVTATNAIGTGPASAASNVAMPRLTLFEQSTPATPDVNDPGPVVLGMRFNSSIAGKIYGVRFYKAAANTGPHTVALWDTSGVVIASATASSETASGWQEVLFSSPVTIAANTDYVAGYLSPKGHYSVTGGGFASAVTSGVLTGVADGSKSNGLYTYSSSLTFPNSSFGSANYFVDVVFSP